MAMRVSIIALCLALGATALIRAQSAEITGANTCDKFRTGTPGNKVAAYCYGLAECERFNMPPPFYQSLLLWGVTWTHRMACPVGDTYHTAHLGIEQQANPGRYGGFDEIDGGNSGRIIEQWFGDEDCYGNKDFTYEHPYDAGQC